VLASTSTNSDQADRHRRFADSTFLIQNRNSSLHRVMSAKRPA